MKKIIANSLLVLGFAVIPQTGSAMTAPHWQAGNFDCLDCHQDHMGQKQDCIFCHNNPSGNYTKNSAPEVATHSSAAMGSATYGQWERVCVDCHDPHVSAQCDSPLISGSFTSYAADSGFTTFTLDNLTVNNPRWANPAAWNSKSLEERGLIMLVEGMLWDEEINSYVDFSAEIVEATVSTITVRGEINQISTARDFKIIYGQYIKEEINGLAVTFSSPADLAYDESSSGIDPTPSGACQVCHTQTSHWRNDGSLSTHFNGDNCLICHDHRQGFKPDGDCLTCHTRPGSETNDYEFDNGTVATIDYDQWLISGHGRDQATAYPVSNNSGAAMSCEYCHDNNSPHVAASNPFRLADINGADGENGVCLSCHATSAPGVDPDESGPDFALITSSVHVDSTHYGSRHQNSDGGSFCWDCHDPHGDSNIYMIHDQVSNRTDGVHGIPTATVGTTFLNNNTGTDYAVGTFPFTGICQVCHSETNHYTATSGDGHNETMACTGCHTHSGETAMDAFAPHGCDGCHGFPPVVDTPKGIDGLVVFPSPTGATDSGAHDAHVNGYGYSCETCHYEGMPVTPVSDDYRLQIGFSIAGTDGTGSHYDGQILNPAYSYQATGNTTLTTNGSLTCTVMCHSDGTSIATGEVPVGTSPPWTSIGTGCSTCHQYPPLYEQDDPKSNTHLRHMQIGYGCEICHYSTTTDGTTIVNGGTHANGTYDVVGGPTFPGNGNDGPRDLILQYDFLAGGGSCSTNSCHDYWGFTTPLRWGNVYLNASPSFSAGSEPYQINYTVTVSGCGNNVCTPPYECSFDWGDGSDVETGSCTTSHIYPEAENYLVTWGVWDAKHHSMNGEYQTNPVTVEEPFIPPESENPTASVDPATNVVTVTIPELTTTGEPIAMAYIYWGDRKNSSVRTPIHDMTHSYRRSGTYRIKVVLYDQSHNTCTFTYQDEPSLEVTIN